MTSTISPSESQSVQVTSFQNAEGGFKASAALARDLERVLVDLIALQLVAKPRSTDGPLVGCVGLIGVG